MIESPTKKECECNKEEEEEDDDDVNMSWLEYFANELWMTNGEKLIEEEDIQLFPNQFNKDLLEYIDIKVHEKCINI